MRHRTLGQWGLDSPKSPPNKERHWCVCDNAIINLLRNVMFSLIKSQAQKAPSAQVSVPTPSFLEKMAEMALYGLIALPGTAKN